MVASESMGYENFVTLVLALLAVKNGALRHLRPTNCRFSRQEQAAS